MQTRAPNIPIGNSAVTNQPANTTAPNLDFVLQEGRDAEFARAVQHSGKVKLLKIALPIMGVLVILGISAALLINSFFNFDAKIEDITVSDGKLVMENPQLNGFDDHQRPYKLSANRAVQDAKNPTVVELQQISASLPLDDDISANITAGLGIYDADAKKLTLDEKVHVVTNNGMSLTLQDADVDIGEGTLITNKGLIATSPQADISAKSLIVHESGSHLIFEGGVKMTLRPDALQEASKQ